MIETQPNDGLIQSLPRLTGHSVLIVGDVMLDEYLWCMVARISPEAPVPVALLRDVSHTPGGAAGAAANVASLGGLAPLCSVIGNDSYGGILLQTLADSSILCDYLLTTSDRPTTVKTRVVAHSQQMLRIDREVSRALSNSDEDRLLTQIDRALQWVEACVISDYAKGIVTPRVAEATIGLATRRGVPVVVDPKGRQFQKYRGATVVTPNIAELCLAMGCEVRDDLDICALGRDLREMIEVQAVLVTRGQDGMTLLQSGGSSRHFPTVARQVFDVTGAGDTVVGTLALALAAGLSVSVAVSLANSAAGVAVGKVGTAMVTQSELAAHFASQAGFHLQSAVVTGNDRTVPV